MRSATIYERRGKLYIHSLSKTIDGIWVLSAPILSMAKDDVREVGHRVKECLAGSQTGIPNPELSINLFEPVLSLAAVKSFSTFIKSAKCVLVDTNDGVIVRFVPTRNEGAIGGFTELSEFMQAPLDSDEALGAASIEALALCS